MAIQAGWMQNKKAKAICQERPGLVREGWHQSISVLISTFRLIFSAPYKCVDLLKIFIQVILEDIKYKV